MIIEIERVTGLTQSLFKVFGNTQIESRRCLLAGALLVLLSACYYEDEDDGAGIEPPPILVAVAVSPDGGTLAAGMAQQFTVTGTFDDGFRADVAYGATWRSNDTRIATVSATGLVRAVSSGSTLITATVDGITDSAVFTVSSVALVSIDVSPYSTIVKQGHTRQYAARGNYADQSTADITLSVTWSSSDTVAAQVSNAEGSQGLVSGLVGNDTLVTVSAAFAGISGSTPLRVTAPGWHGVGTLQSRREGHTATLLPNGKVLIAGGHGDMGIPVLPSELFDPLTGLSTYTAGALNLARYGHTATLLPDGRVLMVGSGGSPQDAPELYDPASGQWTLTGKPVTDRTGHAATLLANGKVLIVGGTSAAARCIASTELYDPATGQWMVTGNLIRGRCQPSATLLSDGKVLVFGGTDDQSIAQNTAEIYNPATGLWTNGGSLNNPRQGHSATLLPNGMVLLAGGTDGVTQVAASALLEPNLGHEFIGGNLPTPRVGHTATLLPDGMVLIAGGLDQNFTTVRATELFDFPSTSQRWRSPGALAQGRVSHATAQLPDGTVIVSGGMGAGTVLGSIEAY